MQDKALIIDQILPKKIEKPQAAKQGVNDSLLPFTDVLKPETVQLQTQETTSRKKKPNHSIGAEHDKHAAKRKLKAKPVLVIRPEHTQKKGSESLKSGAEKQQDHVIAKPVETPVADEIKGRQQDKPLQAKPVKKEILPFVRQEDVSALPIAAALKSEKGPVTEKQQSLETAGHRHPAEQVLAVKKKLRPAVQRLSKRSPLKEIIPDQKKSLSTSKEVKSRTATDTSVPAEKAKVSINNSLYGKPGVKPQQDIVFPEQKLSAGNRERSRTLTKKFQEKQDQNIPVKQAAKKASATPVKPSVEVQTDRTEIRPEAFDKSSVPQETKLSADQQASRSARTRTKQNHGIGIEAKPVAEPKRETYKAQLNRTGNAHEQIANKEMPGKAPLRDLLHPEPVARATDNRIKISAEEQAIKNANTEFTSSKVAETITVFNPKLEQKKGSGKQSGKVRSVKNVATSIRSRDVSHSEAQTKETVPDRVPVDMRVREVAEETSTADVLKDQLREKIELLEKASLHSQGQREPSPGLHRGMSMKLDAGQGQVMNHHWGTLQGRLRQTLLSRTLSTEIISRIRNVQSLQTTGTSGSNVTSFRVETSELGNLDIEFQNESAKEQIMIYVESEHSRFDLLKILPLVEDNLNNKGFHFDSVQVEVKDRQKQNEQLTSERNHGREIDDGPAGTEEPAESVQEIQKRNYGYNTMEVLG